MRRAAEAGPRRGWSHPTLLFQNSPDLSRKASFCYGFVGRGRPYFRRGILQKLREAAAHRAGGVSDADFTGLDTNTLAKRKPNRRQPPPPGRLSVRRTADGRGWAFAHPSCVRERAEDLDEARQMIDAGELDLAEDELRWLLADCSDFLAAHVMLGELALAHRNDVSLARGHFGAGYQLGLQMLRRANMPSPLPYSHPANRAFFAAGRGLAACLMKLNKPSLAKEVVDTLLQLDPSDPLRLRAMLDEVASGGLPIVELGTRLSNGPGEQPRSGDSA